MHNPRTRVPACPRPLSLPRPSLWAWLGLMLSCGIATAAVTVQTAQDLSADARLAQRDRTPILIAFSASYCEWCERIEDEFLVPMLKSGDYVDKVIIRKVETDSYATLTGFDRKPIKVDRFAYDYDAYLTPTLILVDHTGRELTERLVGLTTPELFGGYLDAAIDQAQEHYRNITD